jgi:C2 domain
MAEQTRHNEPSFPVLNFVAKGFSSITRPFVDLGGAIIHTVIPEESNENENAFDEAAVAAALDDKLSLEGTLYHRKGKSTGRTPWKKRLVILDFERGGSLSVFKLPKKQPSRAMKPMYTKIHRSLSASGGALLRGDANGDLILHLPCEMRWRVKDVNDAASFLVEVSTHDRKLLTDLGINTGDMDSGVDSYDEDQSDDGDRSDDGDHPDYISHLSSPMTTTQQSLVMDFETAMKKKKPVRFYFNCPRKENEKTLWLRAFSKLDRLSDETRRKYHFAAAIGHITNGRSRIRTDANAQFLRETRQLEMGTMNAMKDVPAMGLHDDLELLSRRTADTEAGANREFRVSPTYCYPHTWMTRDELKEECNLPSTTFHDLTVDSQRGQEIGTLRVEVLSCLGLPRLDRASETDAVVYLVCGAHAFATDVIPDTKNPIWLRKTRRACIFPLHHGYARLYTGVFDDDGKERDALAGRVAIDLARLRPGSEYDVMLPLRLSTHVYSRQPRGVIRLRFQLDWKSERAALLSYIPKKLQFRHFQPQHHTTIACTNATSFRNVALTVHGADLPGKFSFNHMKAVIREMNFTRKMMTLIVRMTIINTITWVNPAMSAFVFFSWMHCIYLNAFSLVPAYFMSFLLLQMFRNYAMYAIDGPASREFLPPTWEEMFLAMFWPAGKNAIEPMTMTAVVPGTLPESSGSHAAIPKSFQTKTHKPLGKGLLRALGFLESQEELDGMTPDERHLEFPFARGSDYPKLLIKDSVVKVSKKDKSKVKNPKESTNASHPDSRKRSGMNVGSGRGRESKNKVETSSDMSNLETDDDFRAFDDEASHYNDEADHAPIFDEDDMPASLRDQKTEIASELAPHLIIPEQDIDLNGPSSGTKLSDDMAEIKEQMHKFTCHLFNDKTHCIKQSNAVYFGAVTKQGKRRKNVDHDLQRLLQIGQYSHANPIVGRIGQYLEPLVGGAQAWLCGGRAGFNIYTWRDPFLSFWFSLLGMVIVAILFVFPWRLFLFVVGLIVVGPQNLILRWIKERREKNNPHPIKAHAESHDDVSELKHPEDIPLFAGHPLPNQPAIPIDHMPLNSREVHHVVVPYNQLMYQRFYDWPPEPAYAQVKKKSPEPQPKSKNPNKVKSYRHTETGASVLNSSRSFDPDKYSPAMAIRKQSSKKQV